MNADKTHLTPLEKLALSRQALQQSLQPAPAAKSRVGSFLGKLFSKKAGSRKKAEAQVQSDLPKAGTDGADGTRRPHAPAAMPVTAVAQSAMADASVVQPQAAEGGMFSSLLGAGQAAVAALEGYWREHPAKMAFLVGQPVLRSYAKKRPFTLLFVSAAAGAVLMALRPWKRPVAKKIASAGVGSELASFGKIGLLAVLFEVWWYRNKSSDKAAKKP